MRHQARQRRTLAPFGYIPSRPEQSKEVTAIQLREPTSRGVSAGSMNLSTSLDPADKPRDVAEENDLNLMAVSKGVSPAFPDSPALFLFFPFFQAGTVIKFWYFNMIKNSPKPGAENTGQCDNNDEIFWNM